MKGTVPDKICLKFPKANRLHHRSLVERLFLEGKTFYDFPFKVYWKCLTEEELEDNFRNNVPEGIGSLQFLITVPKKKRKKAVDRVLMRRRVREAFRLNRTSLENLIDDKESIRTFEVAFIYIHTQNLEYAVIENKVVNIIEKLKLKLLS